VLTERLESWLHQFSNLKQVGIDLRDHKLEMAPAAHYCLGGIKIDEFGRTNIEGLFAAGEVTGNVHGANRMSGNALSETQVFGNRAARKACEYVDKAGMMPGSYEGDVLIEYQTINGWRATKDKGIRPIELKSKLQAVMAEYVGLERDEQSLNHGLAEVRKLRREVLPLLTVLPIRRFCYEVQEAYEIRGMLDLAEIVILSALERKETRGHHYRLDYPQTDKTPYHTSIRLVEGEHRIATIPVTKI
jgi:fumarate reductase (CoM/CoB) subunit A